MDVPGLARSGAHPMVQACSRGSCGETEDGKHYLVTPVEKVDVAVADAPFLAVEMAVGGEGRDQVLTFRTNVDDVVVCDPGTSNALCGREATVAGSKPYVRVRGRLEALVTRAVYYDLMELIVETDGGAGLCEQWRCFLAGRPQA